MVVEDSLKADLLTFDSFSLEEQAIVAKTPQDLTDPAVQWITDEQKKCAANIVYWVTTYVKTYDPRLPDPYIPFLPYPKQVEMLYWLQEREQTITGGLLDK